MVYDGGQKVDQLLAGAWHCGGQIVAGGCFGRCAPSQRQMWGEGGAGVPAQSPASGRLFARSPEQAGMPRPGSEGWAEVRGRVLGRPDRDTVEGRGVGEAGLVGAIGVHDIDVSAVGTLPPGAEGDHAAAKRGHICWGGG